LRYMRAFKQILRVVLFLAALSIAATPLAFAANPPVAPASFAGWNQTGSPQQIGPTLNNGQPNIWPVIQEYGFVSGTVQSYANKDKTISVALYNMKDSSSAYGLYSYLRGPGMAHSAIAEHSCMSGVRALVLDGATVVEITGSNRVNFSGLEPDFKALVAALAIPPSEEPYPDLHKRLPLRGFQEGTDRYVLGPVALNSLVPLAEGDWVGFTIGAEVETAQYKFSNNANRIVTLIVIDYPTPQFADKMLKEWATKFNLNPDQPNGKPALYAARKLTIVGLVAGAPNAEEAKALLAHLDSGEELTWNEPSFPVDESNINAVIASVIVGTGILCMFTLIAGLAFGGVRLVIKRILPGRIFDRGTEMDVLQLGLASKPINAEDFYGIGGASGSSNRG
jgi:hypothetical protein